MQGLQGVFGLEDENLWTAAIGFGGGIASSQDVCGCVTGSVIAAGIAMGRLGGERSQMRSRTNRMVKHVYDRFVAEFGGPDCRTLTGYNFSEPESLKRFQESTAKVDKCSRYVRFVVETMATSEQQRREVEASKGS